MQTSKINSYLLSVLAVCGMAAWKPAIAEPQVTTPPAVAQGVTLHVEGPKKSYLGGEPVLLNVTLSNSNPKQILVVVGTPRYEFQLQDDEGKGVSLTKFGLRLERANSLSYQPVQAGSKLAYTVNLTRLFDLSCSGKYTLVLTREIGNYTSHPREMSAGQVSSDKVDFSINFESFEGKNAVDGPEAKSR